MSELNLSVPDALKSWVESRVAEGLYSSMSEYISDLVRRDQEDAASAGRLQQAIDTGRASPPSPRGIADIIASHRQGRG